MNKETTSNRIVRKIFKGGSILFIGLFIELGVSFFAKLLIAQVFDRMVYGGLSIGITMLGISSTIVVFGMNTGIGRYFPRATTDGERRGILISGFQIGIISGTVSAATLFLLSPYLAGQIFNNLKLTIILRIFSIAILFNVLTKLTIGGIQGTKRSIPKVVVQNITRPGSRFLLIIIALTLSFGSIGVASAYLLSNVIAAAVGVYYLRKYTPIFKRIPYKSMKVELLRFSAPLIITSAMAVVFADLDMLLLGAIKGQGPVGDYNVAYPLAQLLLVALNAFGFIFMPIISGMESEGRSNEVEHVYRLVTKWMFVTTLPLFTLFVVFPELTISYTFGSKYNNGAYTLAILSVGFMSHVLAGPNGSTLTSFGKTQIIMYDNIFVAALNLSLNLILIPPYGIEGAAIATAIAYGTLNLLYGTQLYLLEGIHPLSKALTKIGGTGAALIVFVKVVYMKASPSIFLMITTMAISMFMYLFILTYYGIEDEEVMLLVSIEERFGIDLERSKRIIERFI